MNSKYVKKAEAYAPAIVAGIAFLLYLSLCFNRNIWTDEAFTIELLKNGFAGIVEGTAKDVHPPLYYLIAKCWTLVFGSGLVSLKLISILPMILVIGPGAYAVKSLFGLKEAILFQVFFVAIPCTMEYAVQLRMYSWAICFLTFMALWAYEAVMTGRKIYFAGVSVMGAAAAYTHYFAFVSALWIYGFFFLALVVKYRKGLFAFAAAAAGSAVLFAPWVPFMTAQVNGVKSDYWIEEITVDTAKEFMPFLFGMELPWSEWIWAILLIVGIILCIRSRRVFGLLLLLTAVMTIVTGVTASALMRPIFIIRYVLPCMGLVAMFLGIAYGRYLEKTVFAALIVFLLFATLVDFKKSVYREYEWTHTEETMAFLDEHVGENDIIAYNYASYDFIYDNYWDDDHKVLWQDIDLDDCPYETIWFLDTIYFPYMTDEQLAEHGWKRTYMGNYGIEHNDFKIWKVERQ